MAMPLALTHGERDAALADHFVIASRQTAHEFVGVRRLRRRDDRGAARGRTPIRDVVGDGHRQQKRILEQERDALAHARAGLRSRRSRPSRRTQPVARIE